MQTLIPKLDPTTPFSKLAKLFVLYGMLLTVIFHHFDVLLSRFTRIASKYIDTTSSNSCIWTLLIVCRTLFSVSYSWTLCCSSIFSASLYILSSTWFWSLRFCSPCDHREPRDPSDPLNHFVTCHDLVPIQSTLTSTLPVAGQNE